MLKARIFIVTNIFIKLEIQHKRQEKLMLFHPPTRSVADDVCLKVAQEASGAKSKALAFSVDIIHKFVFGVPQDLCYSPDKYLEKFL
jgi:hypothetical protein